MTEKNIIVRIIVKAFEKFATFIIFLVLIIAFFGFLALFAWSKLKEYIGAL